MELSKRYRSVVFDLDGTLLTIPVDWDSVRKDLRASLRVENDFAQIFKSLESVLKGRPELREEAFARIDAYELRAVAGAELIDGALDILNRLAGTVSLALVTMQGSESCRALFQRFDLGRFFPVVVTRDHSLSRAAQISLAIDQLRSDRETALFVGDRLNDVNASREVGVDVALVGWHGPAGLPRPNYLYSTLRDFKSDLSSVLAR